MLPKLRDTGAAKLLEQLGGGLTPTNL